MPALALPGADPELEVGAVVGEYEVLSLLGQGGFGCSFGVLPDERRFLVMELLEGVTLDVLLYYEGILQPGVVITILEGIGNALDAANEVGIIHRDIKPENIFVLLDGKRVTGAKLLDFGIAKLNNEESAHQTKTGVVLGTPRYMSPEQARGRLLDRRSDLYSLGVVTFEMLTGRTPFENLDPVELTVAQTSGEPPRPSSTARRSLCAWTSPCWPCSLGSQSFALHLPRKLSAQQGIEAAKSFFEAGVKAYTSGRYTAAVEAFNESYKSAPKPQILFSLAQAERKLFLAEKDPAVLKRALEHFRQYLGIVEQGGRRSDATEALAELEVLSAKITPESQPQVTQKTRLLISSPTEGASITVDEKPAGDLPFLDEVKPGPHRILISAEGYFEDNRELLAVEGSTLAVDIVLKPRPAKIAVLARPQAEVYLDERLLGLGVVRSEISAGEHRVVVLENGRTVFRTDINALRGADYTIQARSQVTTQRQIAYVTGVLGLSSLLIGGGLSLAAWSKQRTASEINARAERGNVSRVDLETYRSSLDTRDTYRQGAYISLGVGATLSASALGLFFWDRASIGEVVSRKSGVVPMIGPGVAGVVSEGTF